MSENLKLSEQCAEMAQTANDATVRSIFARTSELHGLLHAEEEKLAEWLKKLPPSSRAGIIYKRPRD
ncbi:MAG: hypothetical protein J0H42_27825 [Rhizobiales bacterium]|nr:hypothetical protein [Hyphomicrobiales bacterium]